MVQKKMICSMKKKVTLFVAYYFKNEKVM